MIVFNIYKVGGVDQNEGTNIFKILLKNFNDEAQVTVHFNVLPICTKLLVRSCLKFKSKSKHTFFQSTITNNIELLEIMALFQVIATAAKETYYELNKFSFECFELILKIGSVLKLVLQYAEHSEKAFLAIRTNNRTSSKTTQKTKKR